MQEILNRFYNYIGAVQRYSENTKQSYQNDIDGFASFLSVTYQIKSPHHITHFHIRTWIVRLMDNKLSTRSINRKISSLHTFFKYLRRFEGLDADPMVKVVRPKIAKRLPISVPKSDESITRLLEQRSAGDYDVALTEIIIIMLYGTGLRRSELIGLKEADVDRVRKVIRVIGKGRKERFVPIGESLLKKLDEYIELKHQAIKTISSDLVFLTNSGKPLYPKMVYNIVNRYLKTIPNLERRSPHILRHTFATHLSDSGADINAIKMLLGHSSLAATQVYMHSAPNRLKSIYKNAHPRAEE
ncbi:MAG: tyrosine-type recombinase/integrase [Saprospiraceae bacterium]|nr:tyrosine-type recombinase/integrase [Saprospiraceae bacterium]